MWCFTLAWQIVKNFLSTNNGYDKFPLDADVQYPMKLADDYEKGGCIVCMQYRADAFLYPCRHACLCMICARKLLSAEYATCPVCQRVVIRIDGIILND